MIDKNKSPTKRTKKKGIAQRKKFIELNETAVEPISAEFKLFKGNEILNLKTEKIAQNVKKNV